MCFSKRLAACQSLEGESEFLSIENARVEDENTKVVVVVVFIFAVHAHISKNKNRTSIRRRNLYMRLRIFFAKIIMCS